MDMIYEPLYEKICQCDLQLDKTQTDRASHPDKQEVWTGNSDMETKYVMSRAMKKPHS